MSASWKSATSGDWSQAADWTPAGVPDATSDVTIAVPGSYTVTVSSAAAAHSLTLNDPGATLQIGAALTVGSTFNGTSGFVIIETGQTLNLKGPTNLGLAGTSNGPVFDGPGALDTGGTTTLVTQTGNAFDIYLGGGIIWTNTGIVNDGGRIGIGRIAHDSATIVNVAGASFNLTDDPAGMTGNASGATSSFKNAGTLAKTGGTGTSYITSTITNTGTIAVNTGTLEIDTGGTFGGTITGAGTIAFAAGSSELGDAVITIADVLLDGGAVTVGAASSAITKTLSLESGRLTIAAGKSLTLSGPASFDTPGRTGAAIAGPGTLVTSGITTLATQTDYTDDVFIGHGLTWLNTGVVNDGGRIGAGEIGHDTATIANAAGAKFNLLNDFASVVGGAAGSSYSTSAFKNAGLLAKTGGTGISNILSTVTNTGTIAIASGTLEMDGGGSFTGGTITGAGTIAFAAGNSELGGAVISAADLLLDGGYVTISAADLTLKDTVLLEAGHLTIASGRTLTLAGMTSCNVTGDPSAVSIFGPGTLLTSGTMNLATQTSGGDDLVVGYGGTWINTGIVNDGGHIGIGEKSYDTATIINKAGGVINFLNDAANIVEGEPGAPYSAATLNNAGLIIKTGGTASSHIAATITNTGTIAVASGTLQLDGGGVFTGGTIIGAGTIAFDSGSSELGGAVITAAGMVLDGGYATISAANTTLAKSVYLESGHITLAASRILTLSGPAYFNAPGDPSATSIFGPGTLVTSGITNLATQTGNNDDIVLGYGATWINSGVVNDGGHIAVGEKSYDTAKIVNNAGAVFNLLDDAAGVGEGEPNAPYSTATFSNAGLLAKTGGTGTSHIVATFTNTGEIDVATGILEIDTGGTIAGLISGAGTLAFASGSTEMGGATLNIGDVLIDGGAVTISAAPLTLNNALSLESGQLVIASGKTLFVSGNASFDTPGSTGASIYGSGTLITSGTATLATQTGTAADVFLGGGLDWTNTGIVNDGGRIGIGEITHDTATIVNAAGASFNLTSDSAGIIVNTDSSTSVFNNPGRLAKTGGTGTSYMSSTVSNTGTIAVASGTLEIDGGLTNLAGGALTGGVYSVSAGSALQIKSGASIGTDAANITLSGTASSLQLLDPSTSKLTTLDSSLSTIAAGGALHLLGGRGFTAVANAGVFTDSGLLDLSGGTFTATSIALGTGTGTGTISGYGAVQAGLSSKGLIRAIGGKLDLSASTLALIGNGTLQPGDTLEADAGSTLQLANNTSLAKDSGVITLNGAGSVIESLNTAANQQVALEASLSAITAGAALNLLGGRSFAATANAGSFSNAGALVLAGGTFSVTLFTDTAGGMISGFGTVSGKVTNSGSIAASGGTLLFANSIGGAGGISAAAGSTLKLAGGGILSQTITGAGTLELSGTAPYTLAGALAIFNVLADAGSTLTGSGTIAGRLTDAGSINAAGGTLSVAGNISGAGALSAAAASTLKLGGGGALTQAITGAGTLELGGAPYSIARTITISNVKIDSGTTISGTGTVSGAILDSGAISAVGGTLALGAISSAGALSAASGAVLDLKGGGTFTGALTGAGTVQIDTALNLNSGATLTAANVLDNANLTLGSNTVISNAAGHNFTAAAGTGAVVTIGGAGSFTNAGTLTKAGAGEVDVNTAFINAATVSISAGKMSFLSAVSGTGGITIAGGATAALMSAAATTQTLSFGAGTGILDLGAPANFLGKITGFAGADQIDLLNTIATSRNFTNGKLLLSNGTTQVASLAFGGSYTTNNFSIGSDQHGGTLITFTP